MSLTVHLQRVHGTSRSLQQRNEAFVREAAVKKENKKIEVCTRRDTSGPGGHEACKQADKEKGSATGRADDRSSGAPALPFFTRILLCHGLTSPPKCFAALPPLCGFIQAPPRRFRPWPMRANYKHRF
ncbi:hypothetical protein HPB48_016004 [Haemaphysalis longicornis]|uniref:Uncharacterized protein n=1 Tax=Haemaphysalis longicornis TaxID=44386 RepID=A0A9J6G380_HAELO|nr:hypothetical protein HPB48_016004 [Haemaphysalis longicornis]